MSVYRAVFFASFAAFAGLLVVLAWTGESPRRAENALVRPQGEVKDFDPANANDLASARAVALIYECLYRYDYRARPYRVVPALAAAMPTVSEDGRTWTIPIRGGIRFADDPCFADTGGSGRELTAEDFVYAFKRIADPANRSPGWWIFDGKIEGLDAFRERAEKGPADYDAPVAGLGAADRSTLRLRLSAPYPQLLYVLTMPYTAAVPREAVRHYGPQFSSRPVGTGPYRLAAWQRGRRVAFRRRPDGEASAESPERVEFITFKEGQPMWLSFLQGKLDFAEIPKEHYGRAVTGTSRELAAALAAKGVRLWKTPALAVYYTGLNLRDPVLGRHRALRRAMSLGVNTARRIEILTNGRAIPAKGPIPPGLPEYDEDFANPWRRYDPDAARRLLAEAGFPGGKGLPAFRYEMGESAQSRRRGELFADDMRRIGIRITLVANTRPALFGKLKESRAQIWGLSWFGDYPDAQNFLQLFYGPNAPAPNYSGFANAEYDALYRRAATLPDGAGRRRLHARMIHIVTEEVPWIFDRHPLQFTLVQGWVRDYVPHAFGYGLERYYRVDRERMKRTLERM
jgi:ABC-type transport system substrate-binding protein